MLGTESGGNLEDATQDVKVEQVTKTFTGRVTKCDQMVSLDDKEIYACQIEFPRKLTKQVIDIGASIAVFPQNSQNDVS